MTTLDPANKNVGVTLSNGNLTATTAVANYESVLSTTSKTSGKFYFEVTINATGGSGALTWGVAQTLPPVGTGIGATGALGYSLFSVAFFADGTEKVGAPNQPSGIVGIAIDFSNKNIWFFFPATNNWNGVPADNPATNTGGLNGASWYNGALSATLFSGAPVFAGCSAFNNSEITFNFGATPYNHPIPAGFLSWDPQGIGAVGMMFAA